MTLLRNVKTFAPFLLSFLFPGIILLASFFLLGIYPFGDTTIVASDMRFQYLDLFNWLHSVLNGSGNLFYSDSKSLGGNMIGTYAFYLASPFNLLLLLFDQRHIVDCITLIIVLKVSCAGLTSFFYLNKRFTIEAPISLALSIGYALMLYVVTEITNIMWLDAVILLPLLMYGVFLIVQKGCVIPLFLALLVSIVTSWYTGYMLCLFVILFYCFECSCIDHNGKTFVLPYFARFTATGLCALLSSAIILLPTVLAMLSGKGAEGGLSFGVHYDPLLIPKSILFGIADRGDLPQIYCGTLSLIGLIGFFVNNSIPKRMKGSFAVFFAFLLLCTVFDPLEQLWTGLREGANFYCRWAFLISGLVLFAAGRYFDSSTIREKRDILLPGVSLFILCTLLYASGAYPRFLAYAFGMIFLAALAALLFFNSGKNTRDLNCSKAVAVLIVTIAIVEATATCWLFVADISWDGGKKISYSGYQTYFDDESESIQNLENEGRGSFRVEKTYTSITSEEEAIAKNEGFTFGYKPISQYISTFDGNTTATLAELGYTPSTEISTSFQNAVLLSDSLLGIKYVESHSRPAGYTEIAGNTSEPGQAQYYVNPYSLPLAYGVSSEALRESSIAGNDPFEKQTFLLNCLTGKNEQYYQELSVSKADTCDDEIVWKISIPANSLAFFYIAPENKINAKLYVDGEFADVYLSRFSQGIFAYQTESKAKELEIAVAKKDINKKDYRLLARTLDINSFETAIRTLESHPFSITSWDNGHISGTYKSDENDDVLLFTIPFDTGWTITINGEKAHPSEAIGGFLSVPVPKGESEIVAAYIPPGLPTGAAISLFGLCAFCVLTVISKKRHYPLESSR